MTIRAAAVLLAALAASSCAPRLMKLPTGPGTALRSMDAATAYGDAIESCARPRAFSAEVGVSGRIGGRRMRGRLAVGIAYDGFIGSVPSARVEAVAPFGPPLFTFVTIGDDASLLLPRDSRVLMHSRPGDLLDAVAGVPLDAADLHSVLMGCASEPGEYGGRGYGDEWVVLTKPERDFMRTLYLHRIGEPGRWRLEAEERSVGGRTVWRAEYRNFVGGLPRLTHLFSVDPPDRFNLSLTVSQVEIDPQLGPEVFQLQAPDDAEPITLEELRRSGPLAPGSHG